MSERGDLANWMVPGKMVRGMGGAMDLVSGAKKVIITMEHETKTGGKKLYKICDLPLTGIECIDMLITERAVFTWDKETREMILIEIAKGFSVEDII